MKIKELVDMLKKLDQEAEFAIVEDYEQSEEIWITELKVIRTDNIAGEKVIILKERE